MALTKVGEALVKFEIPEPPVPPEPAPENTVVSVTSSRSVTEEELFGTTIFNNTGSTGEVELTLPVGYNNLIGRFRVTEAQYLKIISLAPNKFNYEDESSAVGGYIRCNKVGGAIDIAFMNGAWVITNGLFVPITYDE